MYVHLSPYNEGRKEGMVVGKGKQQKKPEKDVLIAEAPHHPRRSLSLSHPWGCPTLTIGV
jgi:hypothetical protein